MKTYFFKIRIPRDTICDIDLKNLIHLLEFSTFAYDCATLKKELFEYIISLEVSKSHNDIKNFYNFIRTAGYGGWVEKKNINLITIIE